MVGQLILINIFAELDAKMDEIAMETCWRAPQEKHNFFYQNMVIEKTCFWLV